MNRVRGAAPRSEVHEQTNEKATYIVFQLFNMRVIPRHGIAAYALDKEKSSKKGRSSSHGERVLCFGVCVPLSRDVSQRKVRTGLVMAFEGASRLVLECGKIRMYNQIFISVYFYLRFELTKN